MLKFVVLKHTGQKISTHYDLMLEQSAAGAALITFSISISPRDIMEQGSAVCRQIPDHDPKFLTYEGPVNKGLGNVSRIDGGFYRIINRKDNTYEFQGELLKGVFMVLVSDGASTIKKISPT
jgi:hypothetical protein